VCVCLLRPWDWSRQRSTLQWASSACLFVCLASMSGCGKQHSHSSDWGRLGRPECTGNSYFRFDVLTAVNIEITALWDLMSYSLVELIVWQEFWWTYTASVFRVENGDSLGTQTTLHGVTTWETKMACAYETRACGGTLGFVRICGSLDIPSMLVHWHLTAAGTEPCTFRFCEDDLKKMGPFSESGISERVCKQYYTAITICDAV
jgi:hypothetical protein